MTSPNAGAGRDDQEPRPVGDADAVPDSPYTVGHGAEPGGSRTPTALVGSGGIPTVVWLVIAILVLVALVYGFGFIT
ncbi:MAG: hypothetical protein ACREON_08615 [Gemmatimonadaceae bacterium]